MSDLQTIWDICESSVDDEGVLFRCGVNVICVDGTACCKKTSVLARTGVPVRKVQHVATICNPNSLGASMVGYICAGIARQYNDRTPRFLDRSPLNVLEWSVLWKFIDLFFCRFGNEVRPHFAEDLEDSLKNYRGNDNEEDDEQETIATEQETTATEQEYTMLDFTRKFDRVFDNLRKSYYYVFLRNQINGLAIVDSNVERCESLMRARSCGSDDVRATWRCYVVLQNRMYSILYPSACIDLANFSAPDRDVVAVLADFLRDRLTKLIERNGKQQSLLQLPPLGKLTLDDPQTRRTCFGVPHIMTPCVNAPSSSTMNEKEEDNNSNGVDFNLLNITTHVYRTLGRVGCQFIRDNITDIESCGNRKMYIDNGIYRMCYESPSTVRTAIIGHRSCNSTAENNAAAESKKEDDDNYRSYDSAAEKPGLMNSIPCYLNVSLNKEPLQHDLFSLNDDSVVTAIATANATSSSSPPPLPSLAVEQKARKFSSPCLAKARRRGRQCWHERRRGAKPPPAMGAEEEETTFALATRNHGVNHRPRSRRYRRRHRQRHVFTPLRRNRDLIIAPSELDESTVSTVTSPTATTATVITTAEADGFSMRRKRARYDVGGDESDVESTLEDESLYDEDDGWYYYDDQEDEYDYCCEDEKEKKNATAAATIDDYYNYDDALLIKEGFLIKHDEIVS